MEVVMYQICQFATLAIFTKFISDRRQKPGMTPLINPKATEVLKASYFFPIAAYAYSLVTIFDVRLLDWASFIVALVAMFLVVKGKMDLGGHHTWTGYYLSGGTRTNRGVYRRIAHPMTGIILMIVSCSLIYLSRLPVYLSAAALVA